MAVELIKLFQTELEHYEKIEGHRLSLDGKANFLARMVRGNLSLAFQGLVVIPLFCGFDEAAGTGRLVQFRRRGRPIRRARLHHHWIRWPGGDGSFLKNRWQDDLDEAGAVALAVEALVAAAEEDAATGGPDPKRGIYPNVIVVSGDGVRELTDEELDPVVTTVLEGRP